MEPNPYPVLPPPGQPPERPATPSIFRYVDPNNPDGDGTSELPPPAMVDQNQPQHDALRQPTDFSFRKHDLGDPLGTGVKMEQTSMPPVQSSQPSTNFVNYDSDNMDELDLEQTSSRTRVKQTSSRTGVKQTSSRTRVKQKQPQNQALQWPDEITFYPESSKSQPTPQHPPPSRRPPGQPPLHQYQTSRPHPYNPSLRRPDANNRLPDIHPQSQHSQSLHPHSQPPSHQLQHSALHYPQTSMSDQNDPALRQPDAITWLPYIHPQSQHPTSLHPHGQPPLHQLPNPALHYSQTSMSHQNDPDSRQPDGTFWHNYINFNPESEHPQSLHLPGQPGPLSHNFDQRPPPMPRLFVESPSIVERELLEHIDQRKSSLLVRTCGSCSWHPWTI